ncbi:hypothetical protein BAUCODRAFT_69825, partial [Baudoinia panamericana UAMH 10762]
RHVMMEAVHLLDGAVSSDEQIAALKRLKNELAGHDQRKEADIRDGLLVSLVRILSTTFNRLDGQGAYDGVTMKHDDELRLQAALVLGILANGGTSFVRPFIAAGVPDVLSSILEIIAPPKVVTATLQALRNLSVAWSELKAASEPLPQLDIFNEHSIDAYQIIITQQDRSASATQQLRLVAEIITFAADSEEVKARLASSDATGGILFALSDLICAYAIAAFHLEPGESPRDFLTPPRASAIPSIMTSICTILYGSSSRIYDFLVCGMSLRLFRGCSVETSRTARDGFMVMDGEPLLPPLHVPALGTTSYMGTSRTLSASAAWQPPGRRYMEARKHSNGVSLPPNSAGSGELVSSAASPAQMEDPTMVCNLLLLIARSTSSYGRLVTLKLLAIVNTATHPNLGIAPARSESLQKVAERVKQMAMLAVPLAVRLVQNASEGKGSDVHSKEQLDARLVKEEACTVLALLISEHPLLQIAAVDAGAIKYVCPILKKSFDNVVLSKPMWSAKSLHAQESDAPHKRLGSRGLPSEILHAMRCRRGALQAIAALADKEDLHRKAIVEAGVVSCMIDSLKPFPPDFAQKLAANRRQVGPNDGNTVPVILAACDAVRTMSRSVSLLRTSLIDAGVAKPIFQLMSHQDPEVQLAATNACVNLLLEFSPMRDDLVSEGVVSVLTRHARSSSPALRLASLWALKHLMMNSPKELKVHTLEELGTGWLVSAIQGEQREVSTLPGGGVGLSTPNAAGEQVNLLNPSNMDVDDAPGGMKDWDDEDEDEDGEVMYDESSSTHYQASQLRSTLNPHPSAFNGHKYLASPHEDEHSSALNARREDVDVQEQALDFFRNLINGDDCASMFDHLLQQIGSTKIFELLTTKLAPLPNSARLTGSNRPVHNSTEIISAAISVVQHIANAAPRHKQMLIAQTPLLHAWKAHFNHPHARIRAQCVWGVISLTWMEDDSDRKNCRLRVQELASVGIVAKVRELANDMDNDVKERVKTALMQIDKP